MMFDPLQQDEISQRKKTDAPSADDDKEDDEDNEPEEAAAAGDAPEKPAKKSKGQLDASEKEEEVRLISNRGLPCASICLRLTCT